MRIVKQNDLVKMIYSSAVTYPAPSNLSYFWNFGIFALVCLVIQIVTGIVLTMHYASNIDIAFSSVEHIMRDVNYGWLLRFINANDASVFFIVVYSHLLSYLTKNENYIYINEVYDFFLNLFTIELIIKNTLFNYNFFFIEFNITTII